MERTNLVIEKYCSYCKGRPREFYVFIQNRQKKYYIKCKTCEKFSRKSYSLKQLKKAGVLNEH